MLIRFIVNNFLSFDQEREFTMLAGSFKTHKHHVYRVGKLEVLRASAFYGANGAGKSNLIKAISFFRNVVEIGFLNISVQTLKFQLNTENSAKPIEMECEFSIGEKIYSYGFVLNNSAVEEEWLYESGVKTDTLIFERNTDDDGKARLRFAPKYQKKKEQKLLIKLLEDNILKPNEFLLGKWEIVKIEEITSAHRWITKKLVVIFPEQKFLGLINEFHTSTEFHEFANKSVKTFDTGVSSIQIKSQPVEGNLLEEIRKVKELSEQLENNIPIIFRTLLGIEMVVRKIDGNQYIQEQVITIHRSSDGSNVEFGLESESDGTQRVVDLMPAFDNIQRNDLTFVIDEIDRSLHPSLVQAVVRKIMSSESARGQVIFSTHDSNLLNLDIFRQDEIWFVEKDQKTGGSDLYSLSEFKPRYDLDIQKGYLKGRFGAIPFLARLDDLQWGGDGA